MSPASASVLFSGLNRMRRTYPGGVRDHREGLSHFGTVVMRLLLWILLGLGGTALAAWMVTGPWFPTSPVAMVLAFAFFGAPSLGGFWMVYMVIRHEKSPAPMIALAFVPFSFLWYYFERVKYGTHISRELLP